MPQEHGGGYTHAYTYTYTYAFTYICISVYIYIYICNVGVLGSPSRPRHTMTNGAPPLRTPFLPPGPRARFRPLGLSFRHRKRSKRTHDCFQTDPEAPKTTKERPRGAQRAHKIALEDALAVPRGPKRSPKTPQEASKSIPTAQIVKFRWENLHF